jgi:hypothetical protein
VKIAPFFRQFGSKTKKRGKMTPEKTSSATDPEKRETVLLPHPNPTRKRPSFTQYGDDADAMTNPID